jgi:hypothetical protein
MTQHKIPPDLQLWIDARKRFHLSHAHVQMARELGMNPKKLGKLANHHQEPWKAPLPVFIEECYLERFRRERPENVMSIEDRYRAKRAKVQARKLARTERKLRALDLGGPPMPEDRFQGLHPFAEPSYSEDEDIPF